MDDRVLQIVVVDTDEVDVLTLKRAFDKANLTNPIHVTSTRDALALLRDGRIGPRRLVLVDLDLPRATGVALVRELRADPVLRDLTVIVLTTLPEDRDRIERLQLDVAAYLQKPVSFQTFAEVMAGLNKCWTLMDMP